MLPLPETRDCLLTKNEIITSNKGGEEMTENSKIRKMVELLGFPSEILYFHKKNEIVQISGRNSNLDCHVPGGTAFWLITDAEKDEEKSPFKRSGHYWEYGWEIEISGKSGVGYAVVLGESADSSGRIFKEIKEIHIFPGVDFKKIERAVCQHIRGVGATFGMLLYEEAGKIEEWMIPQITQGLEAWTLKVSGEEFEIVQVPYTKGIVLKSKKSESSRWEWQSVVARWFNHLSSDDRLKILPAPQREYVEATLEKEKGIKWLNKNSNFVACGDRRFQFAIGSKKVLSELVRPKNYGRGVYGILSTRNYSIEDSEIPFKRVITKISLESSSPCNYYGDELEGVDSRGRKIKVIWKRGRRGKIVDVQGPGNYYWVEECQSGDLEVFEE